MGTVTMELGELNPKQKLFCQARTRYVAYGGARGGGKSHVARTKAKGGAVAYPGIRILMLRKEYPELEQTVILPMRQSIPAQLASYNGTMRMHTFVNGSIIKYGHYDSGGDLEYQGQEWDWIFMEEATQFTEHEFRVLGACLRGAAKLPRRMYLTCNPGGIGHEWVKRLFVDKEYDPGKGEKGEDYTFIPATVEDNPHLLQGSPEYLQMLESLPEDVREAWRYGNWDALAGLYFPEFKPETHVIPPFVRVPREWKKYRSMDYGLDMLACLWIAVDFEGRCYVYREVQQPGLIVSQAAELMNSLTPPDEQIEFTIGPPDMWNRQKDSGKNMAEIFAQNGVALLRASNNRIQGWMAEKEMLKPMKGGEAGGEWDSDAAEQNRSGRRCRPERFCGVGGAISTSDHPASELDRGPSLKIKGRADHIRPYDGQEDRPGLLVSSECRGLIRNIQLIQHDEKNPSDCATEPHSITHINDALRYFCITRTLGAERMEALVEDGEDEPLEYDEVMTGGEVTEGYIVY